VEEGEGRGRRGGSEQAIRLTQQHLQTLPLLILQQCVCACVHPPCSNTLSNNPPCMNGCR